jgi:hypothetical protein
MQNSTKEKSTEKKVDLSNFNVVEVYNYSPSVSPKFQYQMSCTITPEMITYEYGMGNFSIEDFDLKVFENKIEKSEDENFFKWYSQKLSVKIQKEDWDSLVKIVGLDVINANKPRSRLLNHLEGAGAKGFTLFKNKDTLIDLNNRNGNYTEKISIKSDKIFSWAEQYLLKNEEKVIKSHSTF